MSRKIVSGGLVLLIVLAGRMVRAEAAAQSQPSRDRVVATTRASGVDPSVNLRRTVVVEVVARAKGAVVNVATTKLIAQQVNPFGQDPFFQRFNMGQVERVPANSLGSGFIVQASGYIVTNNHVIDRARQITVELDDGRKLHADLVSADAEADLALLKITDTNPFPVIELGDSADLMIGEPAIAIGNPLGFSHSVSTGIVSAIHRDLKDNPSHVMLANLIQTDAAINPGNSGGPLLNAYGQVIGINTAIRSDAQNIGFAIPVNRLRELAPELMNLATVSKIEVPLKLRENRIVSEPDNIQVEVVTADDAHKKVRSIDGKQPIDIFDAYAQLLTHHVDQPIKVDFADGSHEQFIPKAVPISDAYARATQKLGIHIEVLTPAVADQHHLAQEDGLLITAVDDNSIAARAGLQAGDVIVQLGRFRVQKLDDLAVLLDRLPAQGTIRIGVVRDDELGYGTLQFGAATDSRS